jgi:exodeoxyribonuclease VII small subunit
MSKPSEQAGKREPRFEEAIAQIETLIERIESGATGLEESIANYERGMKLLARCQTVLQSLEQKVAELTADASGKLTVEEEIVVVPVDEGDVEDAPPPTPARGKAGKAKPAAGSPPTNGSGPDIAEEDIPF